MWNTVSVFIKTFCRSWEKQNRKKPFTIYGGGERSESLLQTHICTFNDARLGALMSIKSVCSDHRRMSRQRIHFWFIYSCEGGLIPIWQNPNTCPLFFSRRWHVNVLCHSRREQNRTGSLEPCAVNPAFRVEKQTTLTPCWYQQGGWRRLISTWSGPTGSALNAFISLSVSFARWLPCCVFCCLNKRKTSV